MYLFSVPSICITVFIFSSSCANLSHCRVTPSALLLLLSLSWESCLLWERSVCLRCCCSCSFHCSICRACLQLEVAQVIISESSGPGRPSMPRKDAVSSVATSNCHMQESSGSQELLSFAVSWVGAFKILTSGFDAGGLFCYPQVCISQLCTHFTSPSHVLWPVSFPFLKRVQRWCLPVRSLSFSSARFSDLLWVSNFCKKKSQALAVPAGVCMENH